MKLYEYMFVFKALVFDMSNLFEVPCFLQPWVSEVSQ